MGNRAIIKGVDSSLAVYLHWNGGRDSVEAFLKYCELRQFPPFNSEYGIARFCQVVGNFISVDGGSLGIVGYNGSAGDNGVYIVDGWNIIDRIDFSGSEQSEHDFDEMLSVIDESQPKHHQLGDYLKAELVAIEDLKFGDTVYLMDLTGKIKKYSVIGFGKDEVINGVKVLNFPYVNRYADANDINLYSTNINNYIRDDYVRIANGE